MSNKITPYTILKNDISVNPYLFNRLILDKDITTFTLNIDNLNSNVNYSTIIDGSALLEECVIVLSNDVENPIDLVAGSIIEFNILNGKVQAFNNAEGFSNSKNIVIGLDAGSQYPVDNSISIGLNAGKVTNSTEASTICIGENSGGGGSFKTGSVCIGKGAGVGETNLKNCIILNGTGIDGPWFTGVDDGFFVKPIQSFEGPNILTYDPTSGEISYGGPPSLFSSFTGDIPVESLREFQQVSSTNSSLILELVDSDLKNNCRFEENNCRFEENDIIIKDLLERCDKFEKLLECLNLEIECLKKNKHVEKC